MARYTLQRGAEGLDMEDGTHYNADRSGHVEVLDRGHQQAIERSLQAGRQWLGRQPYTFGGDERHCRCHFVAFAWQDTCPRCGSSLNPPTRAMQGAVDALFPVGR